MARERFGQLIAYIGSDRNKVSQISSALPHPRFSGEEICERGEAIYAERLRSQVETEKTIDRIISIDIETGDYEFSEANDLLTGAMRLQAKHPERIGYNAVLEVAGSSYRVV
jgi:hypothetical protein